MSEHRARPNDRSGGERLADRSLACRLGTIELGCRSWGSVEVRYVDQPMNANARGNLGNALSTFDVYVVISEIPVGRRSQVGVGTKRIRKEGGEVTLCLVITTNEIVHDIGVPDAFCNLFLVTNVPFLRQSGRFSCY
jgi:hypothetical protein